ncbi:hypothetical protein CLV58_101219 [Spirosoma oryzae]|uniref:Uncharacterized protein n=1 Tax=Spirosoma oryzae TaxID=1469603 RepID=A0A2T0TNC7_9BACT|nr:hypothetical protein [Spirosoma oryzae]PRY47153.1 hypothetical protein CLV58_101219 [Spirosoma oryzae]
MLLHFFVLSGTDRTSSTIHPFIQANQETYQSVPAIFATLTHSHLAPPTNGNRTG